MQRTAFKFAAWMFLGSLLLQVAWIIAMPPFRGADEFDHAYRADAVAHGQWTPPGVPADRGRGELVLASPELVEDAGPVCSELRYTGPDNCNAVDVVDADSVTVASAAARYNPAYYWVIGTAALPFEGAGALYAMRMVSALLCSVLIAAASWVTARWSTTLWPPLGLVTTLTPIAIHSTAIPAPNGTELCAALGLWVTLVGATRVGAEEQRRFILLATLFALPLATVRGLGPLWLACILLTWLVYAGVRPVSALLRHNAATALLGGVVVVAATAVATRWTLTVGSMEVEAFGPFENPLVNTLRSVPGWFLQSIAAFPLRNEPAPSVVYAAAGMVMVAFMATGWVRADRRGRLGLLVAFGVALLVPFFIQLSVIETAGSIWQGRYGWPISLGVLVLCAAALEDRPPTSRLAPACILAGTALWLLSHVVSTVNVLVRELENSPLAGDSRWLVVDPWVVGCLAAAGVLFWAAGVRSTSERVQLLVPSPTWHGTRARDTVV